MKRTYVVYLFLLLAACAQLGLLAPQTLDEKITASVSTVTALRDVTTSLLNARKISSDDAQHIGDQLANARAGIDIVRSMKLSDPTAATAKLTTITTTLTALRAYLVAKGEG